jgi:small-conductance mechanosensitive channel
MSAADVLILGSSFLQRHSHTLTAILTVMLTLAAAAAVDRWLAHRSARGRLSPEIDTRLRFLRRLATLVIALLGGLFALSQFGGLHQLAAGLLASSAIVAAVLGFAARQTLANLVAGVMLTITQPLRIGDRVTIEDHSGVVEDVRLNYTVLRSAEGRRVFIPNERLASGVLRNDTIIDEKVQPEVSLWLARGADVAGAVSTLASEDETWSVQVAEVTAEGTRLQVAGNPCPAHERPALEAAMRLRGLQALRDGGHFS